MAYPSKTSAIQILEVALNMLRKDGLGALSMRTLAAELGVRASSLYRYFPDRSSIETGLAGIAAEGLRARMASAVDDLEGPTAMRAGAAAYRDYAHAEPALYDLLMGPGIPAEQVQSLGKPVWNLLLKLVGGVTDDPDDTTTAVAIWSFLHGYVALERSGRFGASGPKGGFERGLEALIRRRAATG